MPRKQNFDGRQSKPSKQDDPESAREAQADETEAGADKAFKRFTKPPKKDD